MKNLLFAVLIGSFIALVIAMLTDLFYLGLIAGCLIIIALTVNACINIFKLA